MSTEAVNITDLSIPQLQELTRQYEQKVQFITASVQQLKSLQSQFSSSKNCLKEFTPETQNSDILVPLTSTLCVPGKLSDTAHVLVDIGTGYYMEVTVEQAVKHFCRRIDYITKHLQEFAPVLEEKSQIHRSLMGVLETKIQDVIRSKAATTS